ncbi:PhzF family phenazine biosynthesis protein [Aspergillus brunneoviolaceus CBS 621.78]|uniref:Phenazine biosynthesis PhzC/PhzF protein n=1 Tax=Aspergillus brunneoviolaceus CBS 621.78 TaxID=1450534 RepID=A0ACD1FSV3_9EURO|nr:phenazine biosynthesis PhzC/PhzF protein [Aspergillus brunneoviolaceus CBS 621.78]RAH40044.1 phenazine biosynthesis PhzC/PhzF protein [Aspergillus brunneoviolaceus CBS 621.78]
MPPPGHVNYITLDVFTNTAYTGNPLAVVFLPPLSSSTSSNTTLTQRQKQTLAREFNFSETIFIHPDPSCGSNTTHRTIDIFTPTDELPFAGHPTIGAAAWFLHLSSPSPSPSPSPSSGNPPKENAITHLITKSGTIPIALIPATSPSPSPSPAASETTSGQAKGEGVTARIAHNPHVHAKRFPLREVLRLHGSLAPVFTQNNSDQGEQEQQKEISFPVFSIVKGMSQVLVEVPSLAALAAVTTSAGGEMVGPESGYMDGEGGWAVGHCVLYFYVRGVQDDDQGKDREVIRTRAIAGNVEDPATGSAACGLAAYLSLTEGTPKERRGFDFVQGVEMGRRSEIGVEVEMGDDAETIAHVDLKGNAVKVSEGSIAIPPK